MLQFFPSWQIKLINLSSCNQTLVNGKPISQVEVQHLDVFTISDRSFRFEFSSPVQKQAKEKLPKVGHSQFFFSFNHICRKWRLRAQGKQTQRLPFNSWAPQCKIKNEIAFKECRNYSFWSILVGVIFSQVSPGIPQQVADLISRCQVTIQF